MISLKFGDIMLSTLIDVMDEWMFVKIYSGNTLDFDGNVGLLKDILIYMPTYVQAIKVKRLSYDSSSLHIYCENYKKRG